MLSSGVVCTGNQKHRDTVRPGKRRRENVFESAMKAQETLLKGFLSQPTLQSYPRPGCNYNSTLFPCLTLVKFPTLQPNRGKKPQTNPM